MSVNGITGSVATVASSSQVYNYEPNVKTKTDSSGDEVASTSLVNKNEPAASNGVIYERSTDVQAAKAAAENTKTYKQDTGLVAQLKADAEARSQQLMDIVNKLISKQGQTFDIANGKNLKSVFENLEVDPATQAQAKADIAEDGYWGVKQTSERIFDFAKALTGGDPDKMEDMRKAFEKGFKQATSAWGDDLPSISQETYGAVQSLFDNYADQFNSET